MPGAVGTRGPLPKRSNERMGHRSKAEKEATDKVSVPGKVKIPPANPEWHHIARTWYESIKDSGQCRFFEPSDWAAAQYVAEAIHRTLGRDKGMSAQLFTAAWSAMNDLLTTEGSRRRVRLELERADAGETPKSRQVAAIANYRDRLAS